MISRAFDSRQPSNNNCSPPSSYLSSCTGMVKLTKAKTFQAYLDSCHRRYSCVHCRAHLANHDDLISKVYCKLPVVSLS